MQIQPAKPGSRGTDSIQAIDVVHGQALKRAGYDFAIRYLGSVSAAELATIVGAGLGFMPVTYAASHDGPSAVAACKALNLPVGTTVFRDFEGAKLLDIDPGDLIDDLNDWATRMLSAGYEPGIYVGAPQVLTSEELYKLKMVRYWRGIGRCVDRFGKLAEPDCGWCMTQLWSGAKGQWVSGLWADVDAVGCDYRGRVPHLAVA